MNLSGFEREQLLAATRSRTMDERRCSRLKSSKRVF